MANIDQNVKDIIKEIRNLDIAAKSLNSRRVTLVHKLETALEVAAAAERNQLVDNGLYRYRERIVITNKVTPGVYGGEAGLPDRYGTVTAQKKTDRGQVKVFFRTDRGVNTHRLVKNIRRADPDSPYELQRKADIQSKAAKVKPELNVSKTTTSHRK